MNWLHYLLLFPVLLVSLTVHEFAHAWSASLLGDDYARRLGRVSLNPLRHLTPLGTLAILLLPFGWGKPVPINLYNLKRPRLDYLLSSLAGPAANLVLAAASFALMLLTQHCFRYGPGLAGALAAGHVVLMALVLMNVMLAAFNLVPIPPLDGSKIWPCLLGRQASSGGRASRFLLIVLVVLLWQGALTPYFDAVANHLMTWMPASDSEVYGDLMEAGQADAKQERWEQAQEHFSEALAINPWSLQTLVERALVRVRLNKFDAALEDLNEAVRRSPRVPELYQARMAVLLKLGRLKELNQDAQTYRELTRPASSQPAGESQS